MGTGLAPFPSSTCTQGLGCAAVPVPLSLPGCLGAPKAQEGSVVGVQGAASSVRLPGEFGSLLASKFSLPRQMGAVKLLQRWVLAFAGVICVPQRQRSGFGNEEDGVTPACSGDTEAREMPQGRPRSGQRRSQDPSTPARCLPQQPGSETGLKTAKMEIPAEKRSASLL